MNLRQKAKHYKAELERIKKMPVPKVEYRYGNIERLKSEVCLDAIKMRYFGEEERMVDESMKKCSNDIKNKINDYITFDVKNFCGYTIVSAELGVVKLRKDVYRG